MDTEPVSDPGTLRASDAERERQVQLLTEHAAQGRLTPEELSERVGRAYGSRTRAELAALLSDLPPTTRPSERARPRARGRHELRSHLISFALVNLLLIAIWAATGAGYFWPVWPLLGWGIGIACQAGDARGGRSMGCGRSRRQRRPA